MYQSAILTTYEDNDEPFQAYSSGRRVIAHDRPSSGLPVVENGKERFHTRAP
jgi:hypothetical protein